VDGFEDVPKISRYGLFEQQNIINCDLLKCDIAGAEFEVFEAAPVELLKRIDRIAIEVHLTIASDSVKKFEKLCAKLELANFKIDHTDLKNSLGGLRRAVTLNAFQQKSALRLAKRA